MRNPAPRLPSPLLLLLLLPAPHLAASQLQRVPAECQACQPRQSSDRIHLADFVASSIQHTQRRTLQAVCKRCQALVAQPGAACMQRGEAGQGLQLLQCGWRKLDVAGEVEGVKAVQGAAEA